MIVVNDDGGGVGGQRALVVRRQKLLYKKPKRIVSAQTDQTGGETMAGDNRKTQKLGRLNSNQEVTKLVQVKKEEKSPDEFQNKDTPPCKQKLTTTTKTTTAQSTHTPKPENIICQYLFKLSFEIWSSLSKLV